MGQSLSRVERTTGKMQNEAARIVTGCTKLVAIADLYQEIRLGNIEPTKAQTQAYSFLQDGKWSFP